MRFHEHLLVGFGEEANEVGQRVAKALRFGTEETQPDQPAGDNAERIVSEYLDLVAMFELLVDAGLVQEWSEAEQHKHKQAKKERFFEMLKISERTCALAAPTVSEKALMIRMEEKIARESA